MRTFSTILAIIGLLVLTGCGSSSSGSGSVERDPVLVGTWQSEHIDLGMGGDTNRFRIELGSDGDYVLAVDDIIARTAPLAEYPNQQSCWELGTWQTADSVLTLSPTDDPCDVGNYESYDLPYADAGVNAGSFPLMDVTVPVTDPAPTLEFRKYLLYDPDPASQTVGEKRWYNWTLGVDEPWSFWFYSDGTFHGGTQGCDDLPPRVGPPVMLV